MIALAICPTRCQSTLHNPAKADELVARLRADDVEWQYSTEPVGNYATIRVADEHGRVLGYL